MAYVPEPYRELAPDGQTYFKVLGFSVHLAGMYEQLLTALALAERRPGGTGIATATKISVLINEIRREVDAAALATAAEADRIILERIINSRIRPDTAGIKTRPGRLEDGIKSSPVPSAIPGGGSVGIADISVLDDATYSPSRNSRRNTYWEVQEFGSENFAGRELIGIFQPGESAPGEAPSGTHPVFEPRGKGQGKRKKMIIRNEVEGKAFLRQGAYDAYQFRRGLHRQTEGSAVAQMDRIMTGDLAALAARGGKKP